MPYPKHRGEDPELARAALAGEPLCLELCEGAQQPSISPSSVKTHDYRAFDTLRQWLSRGERELR